MTLGSVRPDLLVLEEGRPEDPSIVPRLEIQGDPHVTRHATNVLRALASSGARELGIAWCSLGREASPVDWLQALDRGALGGARICSLSFGKARLDDAGAWRLWGTGVQARVLAGTTVVAAVGNRSASMLDGDEVLIPACEPSVIPVSGLLPSPGGDSIPYPLNRIRSRVKTAAAVCASAEAPDGSAPGTSFAAPRVAALLARAVQPVPERLVQPEFCRALLVAASRPVCADPLGPVDGAPGIGRSLGFGRPDPARLEELVRQRLYQVGTGPAAIVPRRRAHPPARLVVAARRPEPLRLDPARTAAAVVAWHFEAPGLAVLELNTLLPSPIEVRASGPWAAAWSPVHSSRGPFPE